jgi:hypothetical protein
MGLILKWILKEQDGRCGLNSSGSGQGLVVGCYEHGNEPLHFIQYRALIDWQRNC